MEIPQEIYDFMLSDPETCAQAMAITRKTDTLIRISRSQAAFKQALTNHLRLYDCTACPGRLAFGEHLVCLNKLGLYGAKKTPEPVTYVVVLSRWELIYDADWNPMKRHHVMMFTTNDLQSDMRRSMPINTIVRLIVPCKDESHKKRVVDIMSRHVHPTEWAWNELPASHIDDMIAANSFLTEWGNCGTVRLR